MPRAQGSLEYLLLIGGAVVVGSVVIVLLLSASNSGSSQAKSGLYQAQIKQLMALNGVGYWPLNGNPGDSSGKGNNAVVVGSVIFVP